MSRNIIVEGIILKAHRFGEIHKGLRILTPDFGLIQAIAHGAFRGKGKLSASSDIFSYSKFYIYYNPVNKSYKINDIEVFNLFENIRKDLTKYYSVSLWAELLMKSFAGGGDYTYVFELLKTALYLINEDGINTDSVMVQYLVRYLKILGYYSHSELCSNCEKEVGDKSPLFYEGKIHDFVCDSCAGNKTNLLSPGARKYIKHTEKMDFLDSVKIGLQINSLVDLKKIYYQIIQDIIEVELNTLKSGRDLI